MNTEQCDHVGYWSEIKLDILREYATAYSTIMSKRNFCHYYIDAFAGTGKHHSRTTGEDISGSPTNALNIHPPFNGYYFIDLNKAKVESLQEIANQRPDVCIFEGDCNEILLTDVFPKILWKNYCRALCLLDPYGLHLNWEVIAKAGDMKSIEIFLNFPIMDINRNVALRNPDKTRPDQAERMNLFWGDESWRQAAYSSTGNLFGLDEKQDNETIAQAFRDRLKKVAGFEFVPDPIPMRNSTKAVVYYLYFASQNKTGEKIVSQIFDKYRNKGM